MNLFNRNELSEYLFQNHLAAFNEARLSVTEYKLHVVSSTRVLAHIRNHLSRNFDFDTQYTQEQLKVKIDESIPSLLSDVCAYNQRLDEERERRSERRDREDVPSVSFNPSRIFSYINSDISADRMRGISSEAATMTATQIREAGRVYEQGAGSLAREWFNLTHTPSRPVEPIRPTTPEIDDYDDPEDYYADMEDYTSDLAEYESDLADYNEWLAENPQPEPAPVGPIIYDEHPNDSTEQTNDLTEEQEMNNRAHASYTIADMIRLNGTFMKRRGDDAFRESIDDQLKYLDKMRKQIPHLSLELYMNNFLTDMDKDKPIVDKSEINKVIHSLSAEAIKTIAKDAEEQCNYIEQSSIEVQARNFEAELSSIEINIRSNHDTIASYQNDIDNYVAHIRDQQREEDNIRDLMASGESNSLTAKVKEELKKICSYGDFIIARIFPSDKVVYLINRKPIIVRNYQPAAGLDESRDAGHFIFKLHIDSTQRSALIVKPFWNNTKRTSYYHPHLSPSNKPCYGTHRNKVSELFRNREYHQIMHILLELLSAYTPDNPHVTWNNWHNRGSHGYSDMGQYDLGAFTSHAQQFVKGEMLNAQREVTEADVEAAAAAAAGEIEVVVLDDSTDEAVGF